jgi:predicted TIM-barrel fold metal-dependent hydrolase
VNLEHIPAIDHHAHNLVKPEALDGDFFPGAFTESHDPVIVRQHVRHTLFYLRSLRDIAELLNCDPSEETILCRRQELGVEKLAARCFEASNLSTVFLDDGFLSDRILPWTWHRQFSSIRRILRLERLAEDLIRSEDRFDVFLERFRSHIDTPSGEVAALKSIAAYRGGLNIRKVPRHVAHSRFKALRQETVASGGISSLSDKPLIDFLITEALDAAAKQGMVVQFHTGFGDPDLDLRLANPLHLRPILEEPRWKGVPIVLLHGAYPFVQEAGYLASVYSRVYLDTGLAVPFLSVTGMRLLMQQLIELAPTSKLMFSTDAHTIPELYYLGARWGRETLAHVLEKAVEDSDLTANQADSVAKAVLFENAQSLYT